MISSLFFKLCQAKCEPRCLVWRPGKLLFFLNSLENYNFTIFPAQACPDGFAIYGMQARFLTTVDTCLSQKPRTPNPDDIGVCLSPKDGAGITGLRLFCSTVPEVIVQPHERTMMMLEFPGSIGDWGQKLACQDGQWGTEFEIRFATDTQIPLEHLGVVQMGLRCKSNPPGKKATSEGIVTPYGQKSGRKGILRTEDPTLWQHNLLEQDLKPWVIARQCQKSFIMGAKVQTDQNDRNLRVSVLEETNPDMVGINNVKLACDIYGKSIINDNNLEKKNSFPIKS